MLPAVIAATLFFLVSGAEPAVARELHTSIDLDYLYSQENVGGDVNAETQFNQKYEIKYQTALTTAYDFLGAVRLELQDAWFTDQAGTTRVAPTLEMQAKGSMLQAKLAYEGVINSTDAYHEAGEVTDYSSSLTFDLEATPKLWPDMKLRYQRKRDFQDYTRESTTKDFEFSAKKDIYALRLEYNFRRGDVDDSLPERKGSTETEWSAKATYKEVLWGGTEFELNYEINENYKDDQTRGIFSGESQSYTQRLQTRLKNSLVIGPRLTLGLSWEYEYEQDLLALDFDYKLKNKYLLDLRWETFPWLKIVGEARRETDFTAETSGVDDEDSLTDTLKFGFDLTRLSWLLVAGKAEFKKGDKITANTGGSVDGLDEEKYELIVKNRWGDFWDFTWDAYTTNKHTDAWLSSRETRMKADLKLTWNALIVTPGYEVSRLNEWEREFDFPTNQKQTREARIRFEYQFQLMELFKAVFSHEYDVKVEDNLDEVLNFERILQYTEDTRLNIILAEIIRDVRIEGEIERKGSDTEDDTDPQLVEVSYSLNLDWKREDLTVLSSVKYNDKGDTFDDVSFNARATWHVDRLELTGEYQFDKTIKDATEPKDERRKLNLKLYYKF
jgi:hypothetical protein